MIVVAQTTAAMDYTKRPIIQLVLTVRDLAMNENSIPVGICEFFRIFSGIFTDNHPPP
jgi:hypothetical protein